MNFHFEVNGKWKLDWQRQFEYMRFKPAVILILINLKQILITLCRVVNFTWFHSLKFVAQWKKIPLIIRLFKQSSNVLHLGFQHWFLYFSSFLPLSFSLRSITLLILTLVHFLVCIFSLSIFNLFLFHWIEPHSRLSESNDTLDCVNLQQNFFDKNNRAVYLFRVEISLNRN